MSSAPKLLANQKTRRTKEVQEKLKGIENKMHELEELQEEPPEYLDERGKEEYRRITRLLTQLPIASLDLTLVAAYCETYSNYVEATINLHKDGLVVETERGTKLSSYYTVQRDSADRLLAQSNKLGLNMDSRLKILSPKSQPKEKDAFADFMND